MPIRRWCAFFVRPTQLDCICRRQKHSGNGKEIVCWHTVTTPSVRGQKRVSIAFNWDLPIMAAQKSAFPRTAQKRDRRTPISVDGHWIYLRLHFPWMACHARSACIWHRFNETPQMPMELMECASLPPHMHMEKKNHKSARHPNKSSLAQNVGAPRPGGKNDACQMKFVFDYCENKLHLLQQLEWSKMKHGFVSRLMSSVFYSLVRRRDGIIIASLSWIRVLLAQRRQCGSFLFEFAAFTLSFCWPFSAFLCCANHLFGD